MVNTCKEMNGERNMMMMKEVEYLEDVEQWKTATEESRAAVEELKVPTDERMVAMEENLRSM
jgi:hypothetical protein